VAEVVVEYPRDRKRTRLRRRSEARKTCLSFFLHSAVWGLGKTRYGTATGDTRGGGSLRRPGGWAAALASAHWLVSAGTTVVWFVGTIVSGWSSAARGALFVGFSGSGSTEIASWGKHFGPGEPWRGRCSGICAISWPESSVGVIAPGAVAACTPCPQAPKAEFSAVDYTVGYRLCGGQPILPTEADRRHRSFLFCSGAPVDGCPRPARNMSPPE
jgi:hypothetical protein